MSIKHLFGVCDNECTVQESSVLAPDRFVCNMLFLYFLLPAWQAQTSKNLREHLAERERGWGVTVCFPLIVCWRVDFWILLTSAPGFVMVCAVGFSASSYLYALPGSSRHFLNAPGSARPVLLEHDVALEIVLSINMMCPPHYTLKKAYKTCLQQNQCHLCIPCKVYTFGMCPCT